MSAPIVGEVQLTVMPNVAGFQERVNQAIKKQHSGGSYSIPAPQVPDIPVQQVHFEADVSGFHESLGKIVAVAGTIAEAAGSLITSALSKVASEAKQSFVDFNNTVQQTTLGLTSLTGSSAMAQAELASLSKFAATTPFRYQEIMQWAESLQAVGYNANTIIPTLTAMGDAVARMGGGSQQMGGLVNGVLKQIATTGQFTGGDIQWFRDYGLDVGKLLMPTLQSQGFLPKGANEAMLNRAIAQGGFSIPTSMIMPQLLAAIEGSSGGMMQQDVTHTFKGAMSNIHDAFDQLVGGTTGSGFNQMTAGIAELSTKLLGFAKEVKSVGLENALHLPPELKATLSAIASDLEKIISDTAKYVEAMKPSVVAMFGAALLGVADTLRVILDVIRPLTTLLSEHAHAVELVAAAYAAWKLTMVAAGTPALGGPGGVFGSYTASYGAMGAVAPVAAAAAAGGFLGMEAINKVRSEANKMAAPITALGKQAAGTTNIHQLVSDIGKLNEAGSMLQSAYDKTPKWDLGKREQLGQGIGDIQKSAGAAEANLQRLQAIAHLAASKHIDGIDTLLDKSGHFTADSLQVALDKLGPTLKQLDPTLDLTTASVKDVSAAFNTAGQSAQQYGVQLNALQQVQTEIQSTMAFAKSEAQANTAPGSLGTAAVSGQLGAQNAINSLISAMGASRGHMTTDTAQQFVGATSQVEAMQEGLLGLGESEDQVFAKTSAMAESLIQAAQAAHMSDSAMKDLLGSMGMLPDEIQQLASGNQYEVEAAKNEIKAYAQAFSDLALSATDASTAMLQAQVQFGTTYMMSVTQASQWYADQAAHETGQQAIQDKTQSLNLMAQAQQFQLATTKNYQDQLDLINAQMETWQKGGAQWNQLYEQRQNLMIQLNQYNISTFQSFYGQFQGILNQINGIRTQMMGNIFQPFQMPNNPILSAGVLTNFGNILSTKVDQWSQGLQTLESWGLTRASEQYIGLNSGPNENLQVQQLIKAGPAAIAKLQDSLNKLQANAQEEAWREQAQIIATQIGMVLEAFLAANNAVMTPSLKKDILSVLAQGGASDPNTVNAIAQALASRTTSGIRQGGRVTGQ